MRVLVVDSYYDSFVADFYSKSPQLKNAPYTEQWTSLMRRCFGTADFYSSNLSELGHPATELVKTCEQLQVKWASEHGVPVNSLFLKAPSSARLPAPLQLRERELSKILIAQAREFKPDVIHIQDPVGTSPAVVRALRPHTRLITSQVASFVPDFARFKIFDRVLTSFPHYVQRFESAGVRSAYFNLGFEPRVLGYLKKGTPHDVVFVGGLSGRHSSRTRWLEHIATQVPLEWWGYGVEHLAADSPLRGAYRGSAWGIDMYQIFFNSKIVLNHHIDEAENNANNMRLYEATGVGALLVTDAKSNLHKLFTPGGEVVAYRDADECVQLVKRYLSNDAERAEIARAGQQRTLRDHTYRSRMQQFVEILSPMLA